MQAVLIESDSAAQRETETATERDREGESSADVVGVAVALVVWRVWRTVAAALFMWLLNDVLLLLCRVAMAMALVLVVVACERRSGILKSYVFYPRMHLAQGNKLKRKYVSMFCAGVRAYVYYSTYIHINASSSHEHMNTWTHTVA